MASGSSSSSMLLFGKRNEEENVNQATNIQQDLHVAPPAQPQDSPLKKRRNPPDQDAEVIALSPTTLMAKNRFVCEVCHKGFPRDQNLQLHKRCHNLPWQLKQKSITDEAKRKIYLCPEPSCVNHEPSHALGDLTGIKKHYSRKHGERKYKCQKCAKMYAVKSDLKAHSKTCGTKEYQCHCGTVFTRRDSFITHRAFCDALADEGIPTTSAMGVGTGNHNHPSQMNINLPQLGSQVPSTQNLTRNTSEIAPGVSQIGRKGYNSVMIRTSPESNNHKPPPALFGQSSDDHGNHHKYQEYSNTRFFTNLVNNTTIPHNNMQLYNLSFVGNPWNSGSGEGSSFFSDHSASVYMSSHTSGMIQLSATGLLQKAAIVGSTYSPNSVTDFVEQPPPQNTSFNMGFQQFSGVKTTRDFLGVGVEMVDNRSSDGPKSNFAGRSFL